MTQDAQSGITESHKTRMERFVQRHVKAGLWECRQCGYYEIRMLGTEPPSCLHALDAPMFYVMTLSLNGAVIPDHDTRVEVQTS